MPDGDDLTLSTADVDKLCFVVGEICVTFDHGGKRMDHIAGAIRREIRWPLRSADLVDQRAHGTWTLLMGRARDDIR